MTEFKYLAVFIVGAILAVLTILLSFIYKAKTNKKPEVKLANTDLLLTNEYYKKQLRIYNILRVFLVLTVAVMILSTAVLLARPYYIKKIKEQKYTRDIILCLDISSSVDELNLKLVKELQDTVRGLSGERIGIVIFNTTPVVLSPLTDDYEYTLKQLENIVTALKSQNGKMSLHGTDWLYWNEYLYGGTLVGNEMRGSSLIADGLMGGLFAFPEEDNERTKIIIFSTDNDPNGESYVSLMEAADYCKNNNATVYGIGTKEMYAKNMQEMKAAVEHTGGKFYLEEKSSTFHEIVEEIETKSENLTEGKTIIKLVETPERFFVILVIVFAVYIILSIVLKRSNIVWAASYLAMAVLLVFVYIYAVLPARNFSKGPDIKLKKTSDLSVVFVIDNTISMLAEDMGQSPSSADESTPAFFDMRQTHAKDDLCKMIDELEGAQFSVISFNNDAMLLAPLSQDVNHVKNAVKSLYPLEDFYSKGSSLNTPRELLFETIKSIKKDAEGRKVAVFFVSDGEITDESSLESYAEISGYVDGGAVMGYGTKDGGVMHVKNYDDEYVLLEDESVWPYTTAISVLDENNLNSIAKDIGIEYVNMKTGSIDGALAKVKSMAKTDEKIEKQETGDEYINPPKCYGFYALIPFAILVLINAGYVVKRK